MWGMDSDKSDSKVIGINSWVNGGLGKWVITTLEDKILNSFLCQMQLI